MKSDVENHRIIDDNGQSIFDIDGYIEMLFLGVDTSKVIIDDQDTVKNFNQMLKFNSLSDEYENNKILEYNNISRKEFDSRHKVWSIPIEYKEMDIISFVINTAENDKERSRLEEELIIFSNRNFLDVLKAVKYVIDTMIKNNITYGVGRGSSVASYVLYKLKVHRIDSLKYDINFNEFLE